VKQISRALSNHGFGVVRFDFTGLGRSEGEFKESHFSANVDDLIDVSNYLAENYAPAELIIGHSLGGAAAIVAASRLENIRAVATIGAPSTSDHVMHLFSHGPDDVVHMGEMEIDIGGRSFFVNEEFMSDFGKIDLAEITKNLRKPLLIMHAPFDSIVGIENAQELYQGAHHPKSFVSLDQADHLLTDKRDSDYAGKVIGTWVQRYFDPIENRILDTDGEQVVAHLNAVENKFTTSIQTQKHGFIADEPLGVGGDDLGPSPYDLLSSALAACTVMTLRMYAERKGWDLQEVFSYITYSKKHSDDLMIDLEEPRRMDHIKKRLRLVGNLDDMQRERLKEISKKCPVHKTLLEQALIETEII
jgi:putative redox protein